MKVGTVLLGYCLYAAATAQMRRRLLVFLLGAPPRQVASVGPDVKDCAKSFPRAMLYAAGMQMAINGTIHLVAAGATDPTLYPLWEPGYLRCGARKGRSIP